MSIYMYVSFAVIGVIILGQFAMLDTNVMYITVITGPQAAFSKRGFVFW